MPQQSLSLDGVWEVRPDSFTCRDAAGYAAVTSAKDGWIPAQVPGEIHLDLIAAGQMAEPSVSNNAPDCRWPETMSWWYRTQFDIDDALLRQERVELIFDGLEMFAQIFVNGSLVGEAANAFIPAAFDVKGQLVAGQNELVVRLTAGSELALDDTPPGQDQVERKPSAAANGEIPNPPVAGDVYGHRGWVGKKWLRKPQFSYGWDWVEALPNIGIWRGVHLEGRSHAVIDDIRLDTVLDGENVQIELDAVIENIHPYSERRCLFTIEIVPPSGGAAITRTYDLDVPCGRTSIQDLISLPNPQLWWPNGMGEQPLYKVNARVTDPAGAEGGARSFNIGLRTIDIDRSRLAEGSRFCIRVNGQEVFCRGGNIGPHDIIPSRITDEKYVALIAEAKNANMNMLRINGCSIFEGPAFYDACDRMGILVWHDFMLTCTTYPENDAALTDAIAAETEAIVKLLRHHASIALWCGNNECTWGFKDWWNPDKSKPLDLGGQKYYNQLLPDYCRRLDPRRPYWPSCPSGGDDPNGEIAGDCHWWHPAFMNPDMDRRIRHQIFDECRSRFVSEYGVIGPCHLDSMREYLSDDEMTPESLAWRVHTNSFEQDTVPAAIRLHYAEPEGLTISEYIVYGQMFQAVIHGNAMEAQRFRKHDPVDDCQGSLIWSYSDCWGETGWSILDYYLRRKASYYWFQRACAPVKVIVRQRGDALVTRVVNDTLAPVSLIVELGWWRLDGSEHDIMEHVITVPANSMLEIDKATLPDADKRDPRHWIYAAVLRDGSGDAFDQSVWTLAPNRDLAVVEHEIEVVVQSDGSIEVSSPVFCHAVHTEDHGRNLVSNNWFDLIPGVPVRLTVSDPNAPLDFQAVVGRPRPVAS